MFSPLFLIALPIIIALFTVLFILLPRYGPHYTSRLKCPRCSKQFNYHWVPGATFMSLRYGNNRRLKCPYCGQKAIYNIATTRIPKTKLKLLQKKSRHTANAKVQLTTIDLAPKIQPNSKKPLKKS